MPRAINARVLLNAAALATALVLGAPALAQSVLPAAPRQVAQPNAALMYWPAWYQVTPAISQKLMEIKWADVGAALDVSSLPASYKDAAAMDTLYTVADEITRASKVARCDFEVKYDDGFMAVLPHLSKARDGAKLLRLAAHQRLTQGNADGAAAYLAAIARTSGHIAGDKVLISSLVGIAMTTSACEEVDVLVKVGTLSPAARSELVGALRALDTADPMNIRATLAFEGEVIPGYLERRYKGPTSGAEIAGLLRELNSPGPDAEKALEQIGALDESGLKSELAKVKKVYEETYTAWNVDGDVSKLKALSKRTKNGEFGPLASVLCPSLEKAFASAKKFRATVRAAIASLEK